MKKNSKPSSPVPQTEEQEDRITTTQHRRALAPRDCLRHSTIKGIALAAMVCLLASAGCDDLIADLGEVRTVTLQLRGTVTSAADATAIDGLAVRLVQIVHFGTDAHAVLANTETGGGGSFSISHQLQCSHFTPLALRVAGSGYLWASAHVTCSDSEQAFNLVLMPTPNGG